MSIVEILGTQIKALEMTVCVLEVQVSMLARQGFTSRMLRVARRILNRDVAMVLHVWHQSHIRYTQRRQGAAGLLRCYTRLAHGWGMRPQAVLVQSWRSRQRKIKMRARSLSLLSRVKDPNLIPNLNPETDVLEHQSYL